MDRCDRCGSDDVDGISRIVGYYSVINDWNKSKKGELKARQRGAYGLVNNEKDVEERDLLPDYRRCAAVGGVHREESRVSSTADERCAEGACAVY